MRGEGLHPDHNVLRPPLLRKRQHWSHSYIYAVEDLLEVEVPERAEYIRLIAVELRG